MALSGIANGQDVSWTKDETPIRDQITIFGVWPDDVRARTTKPARARFRRLPKLRTNLIWQMGWRTFQPKEISGMTLWQEVATTLAAALREQPVPMNGTEPAFPYVELATFVRYEHVQASVDSPPIRGGDRKTGSRRSGSTKSGFHPD